MKNNTEMAIDTLERFEINGMTQWALIRGRKPDSPVLLLIQQGPGFPMIHEAPALERELILEERFRVVYWDQRGTGKSLPRGAARATTMSDLVRDVRAMLRALCERCGVSRVHVVGFSLGGTLGLLAAAEEPGPFASLVCVGPDVDFPEAERFAYAFALAQAEQRGNSGALRALRRIGAPPHDDTKRFMTRVEWVTNFGGVHTGKSFGAILRGTLGAMWTSQHYGLGEMMRALSAMRATQEQVLPSLAAFDLLAKNLQVRVPLVIFQGLLDAVAPPHKAKVLAERLGAELIEFEHSAHMPHHEEPERFRAELLRFVQALEQGRIEVEARSATAQVAAAVEGPAAPCAVASA